MACSSFRPSYISLEYVLQHAGVEFMKFCHYIAQKRLNERVASLLNIKIYDYPHVSATDAEK
jgi:hypothetical protein